ncbi:hypothetical protein AWENTII_005098 [Aspergillus wentii]
MIRCPICQQHVVLSNINEHLDSGCRACIEDVCKQQESCTSPEETTEQHQLKDGDNSTVPLTVNRTLKRAVVQQESNTTRKKPDTKSPSTELAAKRRKGRVAPLTEHVRPQCFDDITRNP